MTSFIHQVLEDVIQRHGSLKNLIFVLPTRRSIVFLKKAISSRISQPIISPEMFSIEEFIEGISGLKTVDQTRLLFEFYSVYKQQTPIEEQDSFERFMGWAPTILQDFNELDRYLANPSSIFNYLKAIKDLDHWSMSDEPSTMIKTHLKFWNQLFEYYTELNRTLEAQNLCYQGMAFRKAVDHLEVYLSNAKNKKHIFLGFNALNKAESIIIQELLQNDLASIYWDTDTTFHNDPQHSAGLYTREFKKDWSYYQNHSFNWIGKEYKEEKNITVTGVPQLVGQAKYVGQLLRQFSKNKQDLSKVAVVLGEENLLLPLMNSIPAEIEHVNITMGLPLRHVPLASLFEFLFKLQLRKGAGFYYKDLLRILDHSALSLIIRNNSIKEAIHKQNKVFITPDWLITQSPEQSEILTSLFGYWGNNSSKALQSCLELISLLKFEYDKNPIENRFNLEYLFKFYTLFNLLSELNATFNHFQSIDSLHKVYKELLASETLDFKGEPLQGLQIMGMLESRVLDFETVILTSVNEGILPGGKTQNSVIPYDIKQQYHLPTYKEKDAVYTYHFYRLLKRAKQVYLIYNTEIDVLKGGEKSRFIRQLEVENHHKITQQIVSPEVSFEAIPPKEITKTNAIRNRLIQVGESGFSPSALTKYVRNPIDYYYQYVLGIKEEETVEEYIAANTLGTILHEGLEELYQGFIGQFLDITSLQKVSQRIPEVIEAAFVKHYGEGNYHSGKNLIAFEVAKRYLMNVLELEKRALKEGHTIKIIALEHQAVVQIPIREPDHNICLKGTVDRIDEFDGHLRIIDYKSGKVSSGELGVYDWDDLITDYAKSKAFQLLSYAYIYWKSTGVLPTSAGIISFKNLKSGVLYFGTKPSKNGRKTNSTITTETMESFENIATQLILELLNIDHPFIEKDVS